MCKSVCKCPIIGKSPQILPFPKATHRGFSMFATNQFSSRRISVSATLALAFLFSGNVRSQDSTISDEQSGMSIPHKPNPFISLRVDDNDDDERTRNRKNTGKGKQHKKWKQSQAHQKSPNNQRHSNNIQPPLPNRPFGEEPSFAPIHPEVIELLGNIHRSLMSIESMMREENERDQKRPEQALQLMNRMRPTFGPQMFGPQNWNQSPPNPHPPQMNNQPRYEHNQPGHEPAIRERTNQGDHAPLSFVPPKAGPQSFVPPMAGPPNAGPRNNGPGNPGPRNAT